MSQDETVSESQEHILNVNHTIARSTNDPSSFVVNDCVWLKEEVYSPIRDAIQRQMWSVQMSDVARLIQGVAKKTDEK